MTRLISFLSGMVPLALIGCSTTGTQIQADCERTRSSFPDVVACTKDTIAIKNPGITRDARAKLYLLRGEQLAAEVVAGRMSDIQARAEWQRLYVELQSAARADHAATMKAIQMMSQQQAPEPLYQVVPPVQLGPLPSSSTAQAYWTGKSSPGFSVTGVAGFNCEYNYAGRTFWRMFQGSCPSAVDVR